MNVNISYRSINLYEKFPMNGYQLRDLSDKLRNEFPFTVKINELDMGYVGNEFQIVCSDELKKLNLFAQRFEDMDEQEEAKMVALMTEYPRADISELLDMTYGLESVESYSCCNNDELVELAFENEWLPVFYDCQYDIIDFLDKEKVAEEVLKERGGYMTGDYYIETSGYIRPEIEPELPEEAAGFFRLQLAADVPNRVPDRRKTEWLTFPFSQSELDELEARMGCKVNDMICISTESALPMIHRLTVRQTDISVLNALAKKLSALDPEEVVKLKAVMELEGTISVAGTESLIESLDEYSFDPLSLDTSIFGKAYLFNNLPVGFNTEVFADVDMEGFGSRILSAKGGTMTSYGAVSGRGQCLFSPIAKELAEDETEDVEDDESEEMEVSLT